MSEMIKLESISKKFNGKEILKDVNFEVRRGERFGIFGPSGCGKTTVLRIIAGLEKPDTGKVVLRGKEVTSSKAFAQPEQRNISFIFQDLALWPHMSVKDHLDFVLGVRISEKNQREKKIEEILKAVNLKNQLNSKPEQLSGGEKQRLALARVIAQKSDIFLLDEPYSSFDIDLKEEMQKLLWQMHKKFNLTTIYVTHDIFEILNFCNRVARMENGKIVEIKKPREIVKKYFYKIAKSIE
jgi:ABC-type sugar transport system ATPase subunit